MVGRLELCEVFLFYSGIRQNPPIFESTE